MRPHRRQPTGLCCPWDSPGKNTGLGCHFLLQCMKVKSESEVAESCLTLSNPMDCSLPGSSVHGIFLARVLEWGATSFSDQPLEFTQTHVHWVGDAIQPSHPLSSPSIFPSIRVFSNGSVLCIRWPKFWSFSFNISPFSEHSGLISFRMEWLDPLALQEECKSLLQHYTSLQKHQFLGPQVFFKFHSINYHQILLNLFLESLKNRVS